MTDARNPDPDPTQLPMESASGSVNPGETPPGESSVAAVQGHDEGGGSRMSSGFWLLGIGLVVGIGILAFIGYAVGLFD